MTTTASDSFLAVRRREHEWMDSPQVDPQQLSRALKFIRRVNRLLGYNRAMLHHVERFSRSWKPGERITMIDVATGSADVPRAILQWADRRGFNVHIVGIDLHTATARVAATRFKHPRLTIVQADALDPPFPDGSFDYALSSMFLHHLSDEQAIKVLRVMNRLARRGIAVADILRERNAYNWIVLFTIFASKMVQHDARVSVMQAFSPAEIDSLQRGAGLTFAKYYRHFAHRFVLAGEKPATLPAGV